MEGANAGLWDWNTITGELISNDIWANMLGYDKSELDEAYGSHISRWEKLVHPEDLLKAKAVLGQYIEGDAPGYSNEIRMKTKQGGWKWILTIGKIIERDKDDEVSRIIGIHLDIDESKALSQQIIQEKEKAELANTAKSDFLANMSHEIRTPMNAIIGLGYLALQTQLDIKQKDYLTKISNSANNLLGIINDILDFSKIEAGKLDIEVIEFDLNETIKNLCNVVEVKSEEKNLELILYLDPNIPTKLFGDPLRLNQILINLVNNAIKFTSHGAVCIEITLVKNNTNTCDINFSIIDSGIGMSDEQMKGLFTAFSQADSSTSRKYGGTGLGLTICKSLVEKIGGEIVVSSKINQGSTFSFEACLKIADQSKTDIFEPLKTIQTDDTLNVLIIGSNPTLNITIERYLNNIPFNAHCFNDAERANAYINQHKNEIDIVCIDCSTIDQKNVLADDNSTIKRIYLSRSSNERLTEVAEQHCANLNKPFNQIDLNNAILELYGFKTKTIDINNSLAVPEQICGASILLVEDNEINQQVAKELLQKANIQVDIADNGQMGVDTLINNPDKYDAILMDIQMPILDGYSASIKIRTFSQFTDIPIIAMTANAMEQDKEQSYQSGMNDHIAKPIDVTTLYKVLSNWIDLDLSRRVALSDTQTQQEQPLPYIEGADSLSAVNRLGGNTQLYIDMALKFFDNQTHIAEQLNEAMTANDLDLAVRLMHTLKSLAGNIGIPSIAELATTLEQTLTDNQTADSSLVQELHNEMAVYNKRFSVLNTNKANNIELSQIDVDLLLSELLSQLNDDDAQAGDTLIKLIPSLESEFPSQLKQLRKMIGDYDFDEAAELLTQMFE